MGFVQPSALCTGYYSWRDRTDPRYQATVDLLEAGILPPNTELFQASVCPRPQDKALFAPEYLSTCKVSNIETSLPAEKPPRRRSVNLKPRQLKVSSRYASESGPPVPFLRMSGWWLSDAGFEIGTNIRVTIESRRLVIEVADPEYLSTPTVLLTRKRFMEAPTVHTVHEP